MGFRQNSPAVTDIPPPAEPAAPVSRRPHPALMLLIGLVAGLLGGGAAGYALWHSSPTATPAGPTATATAAITATPSATVAPSATPFVGQIGLDGCPPPASGQHPLGTPAPASSGETADPSLDWTGCGSVTVPPGTTRFITGDNWSLGLAVSCPNDLSYPPNGMGPSVVFSEVLPGGGAGPDTASGNGPWTDSAGELMAHGGNYQLKVTAPDPRCRWHVAVYTT